MKDKLNYEQVPLDDEIVVEDNDKSTTAFHILVEFASSLLS